MMCSFNAREGICFFRLRLSAPPPSTQTSFWACFCASPSTGAKNGAEIAHRKAPFCVPPLARWGFWAILQGGYANFTRKAAILQPDGHSWVQAKNVENGSLGREGIAFPPPPIHPFATLHRRVISATGDKTQAGALSKRKQVFFKKFSSLF